MQILITGGTGLIGSHLSRALLGQNHQLNVISRNPESVAVQCGTAVKPMTSIGEWQANHKFDAVINLTGEPIIDAQ